MVVTQTWLDRVYVRVYPMEAGPTPYDMLDTFDPAGEVESTNEEEYDLVDPATLAKDTKVGGLREDGTLNFRTEFFNVWNHAQYQNPGTAVGTSSYGFINQSSVAPRLIQFALKYVF